MRGPLTLAELKKNSRSKMNRAPSEWNGFDEVIYAWVLDNVKKLATPVPYKHPSGAVTWVNLDSSTTRRVMEAAKGRRRV